MLTKGRVKILINRFSVIIELTLINIDWLCRYQIGNTWKGYKFFWLLVILESVVNRGNGLDLQKTIWTLHYNCCQNTCPDDGETAVRALSIQIPNFNKTTHYY